MLAISISTAVAAPASFQGLGDLPGGSFYSQAYATSADGSVVVGLGSSASGSEAFIWDALNGMQSIQDILVNDLSLDLTGWQLEQVTGISADGLTIVGTGVNPDGDDEAWIAHIPIPEPGSLALLSLGGLLVLRKRRRIHA